MTAHFSQTSRMGRLDTVLGPDQLVLRRFEGVEHQNALFDFKVDCLAVSPDVDFDALIGTHATVSVISHEGNEQPFDGIVTEARWLGAGENGHRYELRLQPWPFLATLRRNQRIFHNMTVVAILEELLADHSDAGAMVVELSGSYPELEYTVQYRESDFAFACRLMERFGISYHFRHRAGEHDMVLTDAADSHESIGARPFKPAEGHHQEDIEHFYEWRPARRITTGAIRLTDYNFKAPNVAMEVDHTGDAAYDQGQIESFDWPGDYLDPGRGNVVASLRSDGERGQDRRFEGVGDILNLRAGRRVTLDGDPVPGLGEDYLCLSACHVYDSDSYGSGGSEGDARAYSGRYVLMPITAPMVPELKTPRADVKGPQTAVVVGEGEIDCDEYGRILVRFHWDLDKAYSMRCRVSQNWAGNGWGGMVIPRIGMEVLVEFLDGDPDKPMVTGCVYNGKNKVPYDLPEHKTRSTFKTDTHQGKGFNELRFEDKDGEEEIRIHAEKDLNSFIGNNEAKIVMNDSSTAVLDNSLSEVFGNAISCVGGSMATYVGATGLMALSQQGMGLRRNKLSRMAYALDRPYLKENGSPGDFTLIVDGTQEQTMGQSLIVQVGDNSYNSVGKNHALNVDGNSSTRVGGSESIHIQKSKTEFVGDSYVIVCGKSRIEMRSDGTISFTGVEIKIEGESHIAAKAGRIDLN